MADWDKLKAEAYRHRWLIAFWIVVFFGYQVGKNLAHRDNAREHSALAQLVGQ